MSRRCPCGCTFPHVIAARDTADGAHLALWSDGPLTGRGGFAFAGVPIARPRDDAAARVALDAGHLVMGESELWDASEIPALYAAARRVATRGGVPGDLRAAMKLRDVPRIPIRWEVLSADRDGRPVCRVGHLPRIQWSGVAVWHESERYEVMHQYAGPALGARSRDSWSGTGITFGSQRELLRWLVANPTKTLDVRRTPVALPSDDGARS